MSNHLAIALNGTDPAAVEVLHLVLAYRRCVDDAVAALQRQAGTATLLAAYWSGTLPKRARLNSPRGVYSFHGWGCRFQIARRVVDVDFGPDDRHDGFDVCRLHRYAESAFEWQHMRADRIESGLAALMAAGVVDAPRWEHSPHLLYLAL